MLSHILQPRVDPNTIHRPQLVRRHHSSPTAGQAPVLITISSDKSVAEPMNLNFVPSGLLSAMSTPITARGLGSLAVRALSGKENQHAAFIAFYPRRLLEQVEPASHPVVDMSRAHQLYMEIDRTPSMAGSSTSSSRSTSPSRRAKKHNQASLLREMRRVRAENEILHGGIAILQDDLRAERQSRRIADECHQRYVAQVTHEKDQLELETIQYLQQIEELKQEIEELKTSSRNDTSLSYVGAADKRNIWGCHTIEGDEDMMCHYPAGESAFPDAMERVDWSEDESLNTREDDLDDEEQFESVASSFLQQALLSGLTSARVNLELDDMTIKYDPSPRTILRTVTTTFVTWMGQRLQVTESEQARKVMVEVIQKIFLDFWKVVLQQHIRTEHDQLEFLFVAEEHMLQGKVPNLEHLTDQYQRLLLILYKYDIVDGDALLAWWRGAASDAKLSQAIRETAQKFITWMEQDEHDIDDDSDEESDEDHDDSDEDHELYPDHDDDEDKASVFSDYESDDAGSADHGSLIPDDYSSNTDEELHTIDYTDVANQALPEDNICVCCFDEQVDNQPITGRCTSDTNCTDTTVDKSYKAKKSVRIVV